MLALLLLPALLGVGMMIAPTFDVQDDAEQDDITPDETSSETQAAADLTTLIEPDHSGIFEGTEDAERLTGNNTTSAMFAHGGDDIIVGNGGEDVMHGGTGNDTIFGGTGDDFAVGGEGDDRVFLGDGNDRTVPDTNGNLQDAGDDFLRGGAGHDLIVDLAGSNTMFGDLGSDTLVAFDGITDNGVYEDADEMGTSDTLTGGFGNDTLAGDFGDVLTGGADADTFIAMDAPDHTPDEVIVTDFDTDRDDLVIATLSDIGALESVALMFDEALDAVRATHEGRSVAILQGLTAADIPDINVALTPFAAV